MSRKGLPPIKYIRTMPPVKPHKNLRICKNCKHWESNADFMHSEKDFPLPQYKTLDEYKRRCPESICWGWCSRIVDKYCFPGKPPPVPTDQLRLDDPGYMSHEVGKDFGCIHFDPKEKIDGTV